LAADEQVATAINDMLLVNQIAYPSGWARLHCGANWEQVQALLRVIAHYKLKAEGYHCCTTYALEKAP
jgi:hypothetical protein